MTETLTHGYSSESTYREIFNEYQHDRIQMLFRNSLHSCTSAESSLSIERVEC